jgi:hypothetical protein
MAQAYVFGSETESKCSDVMNAFFRFRATPEGVHDKLHHKPEQDSLERNNLSGSLSPSPSLP